VNLKPGLRYSNGDPVLPSHFVSSHDFVVSRAESLASVPVWNAFLRSRFEALTDGIQIRIPAEIKDFDLEDFLTEVLSHPLSGVVHPVNLEALKRNEVPGKEWISSGPYKVRKWLPKEIILVSRDDFPVMLPKKFFRTLKFQSAPIKNPSCDYMLARPGEAESLKEHRPHDTRMSLSVLWMCRSFREDGVCKDPEMRARIAALLSGRLKPESHLLSGSRVRFRIPLGSDEFRSEIRERIRSVLGAAGARIEETSFFFKDSSETDLEIQFVVTPREYADGDFALSLGSLSSRLGSNAGQEKDLLGRVGAYAIQVLMKNQSGGIFPKVFIEPDLDEKTLPF
jgi:hypothetical protein